MKKIALLLIAMGVGVSLFAQVGDYKVVSYPYFDKDTVVSSDADTDLTDMFLGMMLLSMAGEDVEAVLPAKFSFDNGLLTLYNYKEEELGIMKQLSGDTKDTTLVFGSEDGGTIRLERTKDDKINVYDNNRLFYVLEKN